jgi:hypothetical protein
MDSLGPSAGHSGRFVCLLGCAVASIIPEFFIKLSLMVASPIHHFFFWRKKVRMRKLVKLLRPEAVAAEPSGIVFSGNRE